ncbi:major facilitator superfamily domain-containing protein [Aspergillus floccosus]
MAIAVGSREPPYVYEKRDLSNVASTTSAAIFAWWADKHDSRRWPYLAGMLGLVSATFILCFAKSTTALILGRILQGLSGAVAWTVPPAIVTDRVGVSQIGRYLGYMTLGRSVGMASGPLLGGLVFDRYGYQAVYVTAFVLLAIDIILRVSLKVEKRDVDASDAAPARFTDALSLLKAGRMWASIWGSFQSAFICGSLDSVVPLFVLQTYGWNSIEAGASFLALLGPSLLSPLVGALAERYGPRNCTLVGYLGCSIALGLLAVVVRNQVLYHVLFVGLLILVGICTVLFEIPTWADAVHYAELQARRKQGRIGSNGAISQVYGLTNIMFAIGFVFGPLLAGFTYQHIGWRAVSVFLAVVTMACLVPTAIWIEAEPDMQTGEGESNRQRPCPTEIAK